MPDCKDYLSNKGISVIRGFADKDGFVIEGIAMDEGHLWLAEEGKMVPAGPVVTKWKKWKELDHSYVMLFEEINSLKSKMYGACDILQSKTLKGKEFL